MARIWDTVTAGRLRETVSLLQRGGEEERKNLHRMDMGGDNLLILAVRSSNPELVELLLEHGSQPDMRNRKTGCAPLHEAVRLPSGVDAMRILDALVERGAYVNIRDKMGQTPLHVATELAFEDAIDYLLSVGANPSFKDKKGRKPPQIARASTESHIYETFFNLDFKTQQQRKEKGKRKGGVRRKKDPNQRMYKAVLLNRLKELEGLLKVGEKGGIRVNGTSHRGHSSVYLASKLGHLDALNMLIRHGAKPYVMNTAGTTPLHAAAEGGHDAVIEVLLAHRAPIDVRDNKKKTPLDVAFQRGKGSTIRLLLNRLLSQGETFSQKRWDWMFRKAAKSGQVDLMQLVMKCSKSLNINTQTLSGWAPLHIAVRHGQVDAVSFLLAQRGIKTNLGTEANWTPLHVACDNPDPQKKLRLMSLLLSQKGTNPNIQNSAGFTPLHLCAKKHDLEGVRLLLEYNANPNLKDQKGWTPLSIAYSEKQQKDKMGGDNESGLGVEGEEVDEEEEVMHCLIEAGANPNQLSFTSRTSPLFEACRLGMERRAEVLIDVNFVMPARKVKKSRSPASDDAPGEQGSEEQEEMNQAWSVLAVSVLNERSPRIISLLVEKGADLNFTNAKGYTPLHTAVTLANYEVVKILLESGADPNIGNADGTTPLHTAFCVAFADKADLETHDRSAASVGGRVVVASRRRLAEKIIEALLEHGADTNARYGRNCVTLIKTALYGNSPAILASLLKQRSGRDGSSSALATMTSLVKDSSDLLVYLLNMRRREGTQVGELKELLSLFIDGKWNRSAMTTGPGDNGQDGDGDGEVEDVTIPCCIDVNVTKGGRTSVHDLVLSSVFAVVKSAKADTATAATHRMLAFERELIAFLVSKGALLNQPDEKTGFTPLTSAVLALGLLQEAGQAVHRDQILGVIDHLLSLGAVPSLAMGDKRGRTWLHQAAQAGNEANLDKLLALAAKHVGAAQIKSLVNARDATGRHALHLALVKGHLPAVSCLLKHGADASLCDDKGWSSLHLALMIKDKTEDQLWDLIRQLIEHGASLNPAGVTVLDMALKNGKWELARKLAEMGCTISAGASLGKKTSRQKWPLLHTVAQKGNCWLAKMLLETGCVNVNDMDRHMWTAIHIAVLHGDVSMARLLLDHGADPSQNTNHAWSVLHTAAALRRAKTTEELARQKQEKLRRDRRDQKKQNQLLKMKQKAAADGSAAVGVGVSVVVEPRPRMTKTEYEEARRKRKEEKAQQVEDEKKADVDAQTNEEVSVQLLSLLLEHASREKLDVNGKDERGRTALDVALLVGNVKGAKVLAAHGAKKSKFGFPNNKGWNDLHRAVWDGDLRTVKDILKVLAEPVFASCIDINAADWGGLTPLLLAARKPNARVVKELLERGAEPTITDRAQRNCLHHALLRKRRAVVKVIMKYVGEDVVLAATDEGYTCLDLASTQAGKKASLHDLVSRNYKKPVVNERPENRPDERDKKSKQGSARMVSHDVAAWGGQKKGNTVAIDLHEDWRDWQDDYEREQEDYEYAEGEGYGDYDDDGSYYRQRPPAAQHFINWSEYMPTAVQLGGGGEVFYDPPPHSGEGEQPEYVGEGGYDPYDYPPVYDPSFTYPPGYYAGEGEGEQLDDGSGEWLPQREGDWQLDETASLDHVTWDTPSDQGFLVPATADYYQPGAWAQSYDPYGGAQSASGEGWPTAAVPSVCPFCGSAWPDSEAVIAHALAAHNAHLG